MQLVKTYKVKKSSRNKLTKKQLAELRSKKYILFERSWEALIFRLNYIKAVCRKNAELHKYSLQRVSQLYDYANKTFPQELYEVGAVERYTNTMLSFVNDPKIRRMKISITK